MNRRVVFSLVAVASLFLVGNILWAVHNYKTTSSLKKQDTADDAAKLPLLSPRIFSENQNDILINFVSLRKDVDQLFASLPQGTQRSFYFEYLPSGASIRNGSDNDLVAASLIKVPLIMNLYKAAELGRVDLDEKVTVQQSDLDNAYGDLWQKGAGYQLTLRDATKLILEKSDNTATHVVFDRLKGVLNEDEQSLKQLDVEQKLQDGQAVVNARSYSSILRSLYLSSYVSKEHSQEILGYLSNSEETRRLTKDLPANITVAHKNGVFNANWSESDCGIVYVPKRPYMICVMVGLPEDQANDFIASISKKVYDYVTTQ